MVLGKKKKDRGDWSWNMTPEAYEAIKKLHEHDKRATMKNEDKDNRNIHLDLNRSLIERSN